MFKGVLILGLLFLTACAPKSGDQQSPGPACCGSDSEGEKIFQKSSSNVSEPTSILGTWELPSDVGSNSKATVRVEITQSSMTIAGKCEFMKDGRTDETLYAVASTPSSFTEDTLTSEKSVEQKKTSGERECRVFIKAASNKYILNREEKTFCITVADRCVAVFTKIAD